MILCIRPSWDIDRRCNIDCKICLFFLELEYFSSFFVATAKCCPSNHIPCQIFKIGPNIRLSWSLHRKLQLKWNVGGMFYNKFNHTIIIKTKNISFSGKIMETAHWRKGEKDYTSMWQRKEKVGHLVCEKLVTSTSLKWLKYLGILMFIPVFIGLKMILKKIRKFSGWKAGLMIFLETKVKYSRLKTRHWKLPSTFLDGTLGWWSFYVWPIVHLPGPLDQKPATWPTGVRVSFERYWTSTKHPSLAQAS